MDLKQLKIELDSMLYEVFGDVGEAHEIVAGDKFLYFPVYELRIFKNNGDFLIYHVGVDGSTPRFKSEDHLKVLWSVGEEIAKIRIYAATISG